MALQNLQQFSGSISISGNEQLTSLNGLGQIPAENIDFLAITSCPQLSMCSESNFCTYLKNDGEHFIRFNASGCGSLTEILDNCVASTTSEIFQRAVIQVSPNPTPGLFQIQGLAPNWQGSVDIINAQGQVIHQQPYQVAQSIYLGDVPPGLYFLRLWENGVSRSLRVLKK